MHDLLIVAIPTLTVMFGILLNRQDANAIRAELKSEIASVRSELRSELRGEIGSLRSEMISLRDSIHRDMIGLHERIVTVEAKQNS